MVYTHRRAGSMITTHDERPRSSAMAGATLWRRPVLSPRRACFRDAGFILYRLGNASPVVLLAASSGGHALGLALAKVSARTFVRDRCRRGRHFLYAVFPKAAESEESTRREPWRPDWRETSTGSVDGRVWLDPPPDVLQWSLPRRPPHLLRGRSAVWGPADPAVMAVRRS